MKKKAGIMMVNEKIKAAEENLIHVYNRFPIALERGEGVYLYDTNGKKYLDFAAGFAVSGLGYGNQKLNAALKFQIDQLYHTVLLLTSRYLHRERLEGSFSPLVLLLENSPPSVISSIVSLLYPEGSEIPVLKTLAAKQYGNP